MNLPYSIETSRLRLRRLSEADAQVVFDRWATDPDVTRYMSWPRHRTLDDSLSFIAFSDAQWTRWSAGPYLIETLCGGTAIGSCGFGFQSDAQAEIGYVLASEFWGLGYATECVHALVAVARTVAPIELFAPVHPDNVASMSVLRKCGFALDTQGVSVRFPNICGDTEVRASRFFLSLPQCVAV